MKTLEISELKQMIADQAANLEQTRLIIEKSSQETDRKLQESREEFDKKLQDSEEKFDKRMQESQEKFDKKLQDSEEKFDKRMQELQEKFDKIMQESRADYDRRQKELDERLEEDFKKTRSFFETQWSKFLESLVEGDLIPLLQQRGIGVTHTLQNIHGNPKGDNFEFDIIAVNGGEIVVVEVKTTLTNKDVKEFLAKLKKVKSVYLREYSNYKIYGAMAYLRVEGASDKQAINKKLFVIRATGNSASIVNSEDFEPRVF